MIAADTSSLVAYFNGEAGRDVERLVAAMTAGDLALPPVVITAVLTDPAGSPIVEDEISELATLDIRDGYWARAGRARRILIMRGFKARVGDALIAQSCIDHDVALITRDRDFRQFARHCGLKLA